MTNFGRTSCVGAVARSLAIALAIQLLADGAAWADCTPAAANGVAATCSGATINQGAGAPGTSAAINGYGSGTETGVTVNVAAGNGNTVTGNFNGIYLSDPG